MRPQLANIYISDGAWRLHFIGLPDDTSPTVSITGNTAAELAAAARQLIDQYRATASETILSLPSHWCLAAQIQTLGLSRRQRQAGLIYRLEEKLPIDAEQFAADFSHGSTGALGVAVESAMLLPIIDACTEQGIHISAITPQALLAAASAMQQSQCDPAHVVLLEDNNQADIITISRGQPRSWMLCSADISTIQLQLKRLQLTSEDACPVVIVSTDADLLAEFGSESSTSEIHQINALPSQLATEAAGQLHQAGRPPCINLRSGPLAPTHRLRAIEKPLTAAVIAALVLLATTSSIALWRSSQYNKLAQSLHQQQEVIYREAFPNQQVPAAILARLQSEARKLEGMRGNRSSLPSQLSVLQLLQDTLTNLPTQLRYRILELRLDQQRFYLDGQARSHSDADAIAANLRNAGGLAIEPPRTENLPDHGVAFTLTGSPVQEVTP